MSRDDRGYVTAEMAAVLPVLVALLAVSLAAVGAVTAQMRCVDAAREGARAAARDEPSGRVIAVARAVAPAGARVEVSRIGADAVAVTVHAPAPLLGRLLAPLTLHARAVALLEPAAPA